MKILVKNIPNTGKDHCDCCGAWVKHWEKHSNGKLADHCYACGARNVEIVGGHVERYLSLDTTQFVIPICNSCNQKEDLSFQVDKENLVRVDMCEKIKEARAILNSLLRNRRK